MNVKSLFHPDTPWSIIWVVLSWIVMYLIFNELFLLLIMIAGILGVLSLFRSFVTRKGRSNWFLATILEDFFVISYAVFLSSVTLTIAVLTLPTKIGLFGATAWVVIPSAFVLAFSLFQLHHIFLGHQREAGRSLKFALAFTLVALIIAMISITGVLYVGTNNLRDSWGQTYYEPGGEVGKPNLKAAEDISVARSAFFGDPEWTPFPCGMICSPSGLADASAQMVHFVVYSSSPEFYETAENFRQYHDGNNYSDAARGLVSLHGRFWEQPYQQRPGDYGGMASRFACDANPLGHVFLVGMFFCTTDIIEMHNRIQNTFRQGTCTIKRVDASAAWDGLGIEESMESEQLRYYKILEAYNSGCWAPRLR